ncbi:MAG TPA: hypothetical protein PLQ97_10590 [Myxococcota bacterium]|nr:hypothetical protein [Myxococcota bacterium]HQK51241.1 hypothetical protein [Myxococcota bacterium]
MRHGRMATLWALGCVAAGCGDGKDGAGTEAVSGRIAAATGGTVAFGDGTGIQIPAGALAEDTTITLSRPASRDVFRAEGTVGILVLEPDGLTLSTPATVTWVSDLDYDQEGLAVEVVSRTNPFPRAGSEVDPFVTAEDVTVSGGRITFPLRHFSVAHILSYPKFLAAIEFPASTLRPGDILYVLTSAEGFTHATIKPMHVGLYLGQGKVIESTLQTPTCGVGIDGVDIHDYLDFMRLCGAHVFVGARRPREGATEEAGKAAVAWATGKQFEPYGILGGLPIGTGGAGGFGGWSCVGLAEAAWEAAGVNIVSAPDALLTPYMQFANTVAVQEVEVKATDEKLQFGIVGAAREANWLPGLPIPGGFGDYATVQSEAMTVTVTATPDAFAADRVGSRAVMRPPTSPELIQVLEFTPDRSDAGDTFVFHFEVADPSRGYKAPLSLIIRIDPCGNGECETSEGEDHGTCPVDCPAEEPAELNSCPVKALCDYCETPQVGSAWLGELMIMWSSATTLGQFSLSGRNPTTNEEIDFGVTFSGGKPRETTFQVTRDRVFGTYVHDPELTGFCCSRYTAPDGRELDIYGAEIDLAFSGDHASGAIVVLTEEGATATIEVQACTCPCL